MSNNFSEWSYDEQVEWLGCEDDYQNDESDLRNTDVITGCEDYDV